MARDTLENDILNFLKSVAPDSEQPTSPYNFTSGALRKCLVSNGYEEEIVKYVVELLAKLVNHCGTVRDAVGVVEDWGVSEKLERLYIAENIKRSLESEYHGKFLKDREDMYALGVDPDKLLSQLGILPLSEAQDILETLLSEAQEILETLMPEEQKIWETLR